MREGTTRLGVLSFSTTLSVLPSLSSLLCPLASYFAGPFVSRRDVCPADEDPRGEEAPQLESRCL